MSPRSSSSSSSSSDRLPEDLGIVVVFDPEGKGADFAYTTACAPHLGFELHIWARPSSGQDPAADWILSPRDRASLLRMAAGKVAEGSLAPGGQLSVDLDGGLSTLEVTLSDPQGAHELDAFQLDPATPVVALRHALQRAPAGDEQAPPPPEAIAALSDALAAAQDSEPEAAVYWDLAPLSALEELSVETTTALRVWAPLVERRRDFIGRLIGSATASECVLVAPIAAQGLITFAAGVVSEQARRAGRVGALDAAVEVAASDARLIAPLLVDEMESEPDRDQDQDQGQGQDIRAMAAWLTQTLGLFYGTAVLLDLLDESQRAAACGWIEACSDPRRATDRFADVADKVLGSARLKEAMEELDSLADPITDDSCPEWLRDTVIGAHLAGGAPLTMDWLGVDELVPAAPDEALGELIAEVVARLAADAGLSLEP